MKLWATLQLLSKFHVVKKQIDYLYHNNFEMFVARPFLAQVLEQNRPVLTKPAINEANALLINEVEKQKR